MILDGKRMLVFGVHSLRSDRFSLLHTEVAYNSHSTSTLANLALKVCHGPALVLTTPFLFLGLHHDKRLNFSGPISVTANTQLISNTTTVIK